MRECKRSYLNCSPSLITCNHYEETRFRPELRQDPRRRQSLISEQAQHSKHSLSRLLVEKAEPGFQLAEVRLSSAKNVYEYLVAWQQFQT